MDIDNANKEGIVYTRLVETATRIRVKKFYCMSCDKERFTPS